MVADKVPKKTVLTMNKHPIKEYHSNMERLSVIEKKGTMMLLMDYTRIVVPLGFRKEVLRREHISPTGRRNMEGSLHAKYYWPKLSEDVKRVVEACMACQVHGNSREWESLRLAQCKALGLTSSRGAGTTTSSSWTTSPGCPCSRR